MKPLYLSLLSLLFLAACTKKENFRPQLSAYPAPGNAIARIDDDSIGFYPSCIIEKQSDGSYSMFMGFYENVGRRYFFVNYAKLRLEQSDYLIEQIKGRMPTKVNAGYLHNIDLNSWENYAFATGGSLSIHSYSDSIVRGSFNFTTGSDRAKYIKGVFTVKAYYAD